MPAGGVGGVEVAGQRAQRPAVGGDVVDQQYQHVLVVGGVQDGGADRDLGG